MFFIPLCVLYSHFVFFIPLCVLYPTLCSLFHFVFSTPLCVLYPTLCSLPHFVFFIPLCILYPTFQVGGAELSVSWPGVSYWWSCHWIVASLYMLHHRNLDIISYNKTTAGVQYCTISCTITDASRALIQVWTSGCAYITMMTMKPTLSPTFHHNLCSLLTNNDLQVVITRRFWWFARALSRYLPPHCRCQWW